MADIKIDAKKLILRLSKISSGLKDMTQLFKNIADLELSQTRKRFIDQQDPESNDWPDPITLRRGVGPETGSGARSSGLTQQQLDNPWAYVVASNFHATPPRYRFFDRSKGDKALRDTGNLLNSIGIAYGKDYAIVGTNLKYATNLQNGRFPFLGINKKTDENVRTATQSFLRRLSK